MKSTKVRLGSLLVSSLLLFALAAQAPAAGYGVTNLARGKAITPITGTVQGSPSGVTDGSYDGNTSMWYSLNCTGWSPCINQFTLDLGASYAIGKINVYPLQTHQFRVLSSTDGTTWTERHKYNWITSSGFYLGGGSPPVSLRPDGSYSARYLKYEASADWYQYVGVYELEVYEWVANPPPEPSLSGLTNLALGKTVTDVTGFSSVSGHAPGLLTDGNVSTYWQGNYGSDQCSAVYRVLPASVHETG